MAQPKNKFEAARKMSGISLQEMAITCDMSPVTASNREKSPMDFRLCELSALYETMTDSAKPILKEAVDEIFLA
jgi:DNA-binding XRE family transcriptional regulator